MKKISALLILLLPTTTPISACPMCNKAVSNAIYNSQFYPNLVSMLSAFIVLSVIVVIMAAASTARHKRWIAENPYVTVLSPIPLTTASTVLGIGMGGFVDGIVFHQILQAHEMLSNKIPATDYIGKSVNMFWDGIFHAFCFITVIIGIVLLWKLLLRNDVTRSGKLLAAGLLFGWGIFNLVEGIADHQVLKLHNVIEYAGNHTVGNYIFLGSSIVLAIAGWLLLNSEKRNAYRIIDYPSQP